MKPICIILDTQRRGPGGSLLLGVHNLGKISKSKCAKTLQVPFLATLGFTSQQVPLLNYFSNKISSISVGLQYFRLFFHFYRSAREGFIIWAAKAGPRGRGGVVLGSSARGILEKSMISTIGINGSCCLEQAGSPPSPSTGS